MTRRYFIGIFAAVILSACVQPERRLPVDKAALLLIIQKVAQAKHTNFQQGVGVLRSYQKQYQFAILHI